MEKFRGCSYLEIASFFTRKITFFFFDSRHQKPHQDFLLIFSNRSVIRLYAKKEQPKSVNADGFRRISGIGSGL